MGLFSLYSKPKGASGAAENPNLASLPPDERKRPTIGKPEEKEEKKNWRDSEGNINRRDVELAEIELRRKGMSRRKVSTVDAAIHSALDEPGRDRINSGELNEVMEVLEEEAHHLGLDKGKDLGRIRDAFEKRL